MFLGGSCKCTSCRSILLHCNVLSSYIFTLYCVARINDGSCEHLDCKIILCYDDATFT